MATLLFKVGSLTVKSISKPMAKRFEAFMMGHQKTRSAIVKVAQVLHRGEVWLTRRSEGREGKLFVGDMTEQRAVALAAQIASEGFVYTTGVALVLLEASRKAREDRSKAEKSAEEKREIRALHDRHLEREAQLAEQQIELQALLKRIDERVSGLERAVEEASPPERRRGWFR